MTHDPSVVSVDHDPDTIFIAHRRSAEAKAVELQRQARYLLSIACLVNDAAKHDELRQKAQELLAKVQLG
jgi:hypothetical protein